MDINTLRVTTVGVAAYDCASLDEEASYLLSQIETQISSCIEASQSMTRRPSFKSRDDRRMVKD